MGPLLPLASLIMGSQSGPILTIDQAIKFADQNAFAILIQQTAVEKSRQKAAESAAALGPKVNIGANYTRFDSALSSNFNGNSTVIQPIDTKSANASLNLPIDITGNTRRILHASKALYYAQKETLQATRNDVHRSVRTAYYAVLRAKNQVVVAQEAVQGETERVKNTQQQFAQGTVAKVDVLRSQTQLAQSTTDLITAENALQLSEQSLNNVLGRPIETPLEVAEVEVTPNVSTDANALAEKAKQSRPEARALERTKEALSYIRRSQEQGLQPALNLSVTYTKNIDAQGFSARDQQTTGVLALTWPIWDSGGTRARVKQARQDEAQAALQLKQLQLGISLEIRQALTNLANARNRNKVALDQVATAKETLRLAQLKRQEGEGILIEVLDAQTALTQAETSQVNSRYDLFQAVADLQRAYGDDQLPTATAVGETK